MKDEVLKHLHDIREAALAIKAFVAERSFDDYAKDELLRSGVERKFEIIGDHWRSTQQITERRSVCHGQDP
jgi:uncharacterized protein with HEPN domain